MGQVLSEFQAVGGGESACGASIANEHLLVPGGDQGAPKGLHDLFRARLHPQSAYCADHTQGILHNPRHSLGGPCRLSIFGFRELRVIQPFSNALDGRARGRPPFANSICRCSCPRGPVDGNTVGDCWRQLDKLAQVANQSCSRVVKGSGHKRRSPRTQTCQSQLAHLCRQTDGLHGRDCGIHGLELVG